MRAVVQRVSEARVTVAGSVVGSIEQGLCVLLGIADGDDARRAAALATKVARLRVFEDAGGRFNLSLADIGGHALVVSQFTLLADTTRGSRPSFSAASPPELAEELYERFIDELRRQNVGVETGRFGAKMALELTNDGPVTFVLDG